MKNVLFFVLDFQKYESARSWSYETSYGFIDGLRENHIEVDVVPCLSSRFSSKELESKWFNFYKTQIGQKQYDAVFLYLVHKDYSLEFFDWIKKLSDIRIGIVPETLTHTLDECENNAVLLTRLDAAKKQIEHLTHTIIFDEGDLKSLKKDNVFWMPLFVPEKSIKTPIDYKVNKAMIIGKFYNAERAEILRAPSFQNHVVHPILSERLTSLPYQFENEMSQLERMYLDNTIDKIHSSVVRIHKIREQIFEFFMNDIQSFIANINPPSTFKSYTSRVVSSMAVGVPCISWRLNDRPETQNLFTDNEDILLFDRKNIDEIITLVDKLQDTEFRKKIVIQAQHLVKSRHTSKIRIKEILDWVFGEKAPPHAL